MRNALGRNICQHYRHTDSKVHVITLDPALEDFINNSIEHTERGSFMTLSPEMLSVIVSRIASQVERMVVEGLTPVILCAPQIRLQVKKMLEGRIPGIVVLSYNEIVKEIQIESHGTVTVENSKT